MSFSRLTLLLFVTFQIADGAMTYGAVSIFGTHAEANPILVTWMQLVGIGSTLIVAKLLACGAGVLLYYYYRRGPLVLGALTVCYAFGAVLPWLRALSQI